MQRLDELRREMDAIMRRVRRERRRADAICRETDAIRREVDELLAPRPSGRHGRQRSS